MSIVESVLGHSFGNTAVGPHDAFLFLNCESVRLNQLHEHLLQCQMHVGLLCVYVILNRSSVLGSTLQ